MWIIIIICEILTLQKEGVSFQIREDWPELEKKSHLILTLEYTFPVNERRMKKFYFTAAFLTSNQTT